MFQKQNPAQVERPFQMIAGIKYWSEREKVDPVWLVVPLESQMHGPEM